MDHLRLAPAAFAAAAMFSFALATPALADPPSQHGHSPIQPHHNKDGSVQRGGPDFLLITGNWAGYAVGNFQTGQKYTAARASWVVAPITFGPTLSDGSDEFAANWVGIGGYCTDPNCAGVDPTLIQLGTTSEVAPDGTTTYAAFFEMLPQPPFTIPITIHAGDQVTAELQCTGSCKQKKQSWTLTMANLTTNEHWSQTVGYASSLLSAEWIEEAPVMGGVLPLAQFTVAPFARVSANDGFPAMTFADNGILMGDPWGQIGWISAPGAFNAFDVCYGAGVIPPCPTP